LTDHETVLRHGVDVWQRCAATPLAGSFMSDASATFAPNRMKLMIMVLPKIELNELSVKAEADGLTLNDLVPICERFGVAPQSRG